MSEQETVDAFPAKAFFVKMLTRDISLEDAIMDLVDNCVDGILRTKWSKGVPENEEEPYKSFWARIIINEKEFSIEDNCGGIPWDIAKENAFTMGRKNKREINLPTVGVYGIGMKRALFKMGANSEVFSKTEDCSYKVTIDSSWLEDDSNWTLPLTLIDNAEKTENGTIIKVTDLYDYIASSFSTKVFISRLITLIQQHYSFILQKGFKIVINEAEVKPMSMELLFEDNFQKDSLAPFIYKANIDGVNVLLEVGFYRSIPTEDEIDEEQVAKRSKDEAGWTIVCNDRVVLYKDKTMLTGWGEATVPHYHNQFINIAGMVRFKSDDAEKLPITTTKRGIDASSTLYLKVKNQMREGMKLFTNYTNTWKKDLSKEREVSSNAKSKDIFELALKIPEKSWAKIPGTNSEEYRFFPKLPKPSEINPRKHIRFARPQLEIETVSEYLFDSPDIPAAQVGEKCFEKILEESKNI